MTDDLAFLDATGQAELVRAGGGNEEERLALLQAHRGRVLAQLGAMAAHLDAIEEKISYYARAASACMR